MPSASSRNEADRLFEVLERLVFAAAALRRRSNSTAWATKLRPSLKIRVVN